MLSVLSSAFPFLFLLNVYTLAFALTIEKVSQGFSFLTVLPWVENLGQAFVFYSTITQFPNGPTELYNLLSSGAGDHGQAKIMLRAYDQKVYMMWVLEVDMACTWSIDDASAHLSSFLQGNGQSSTTMFFGGWAQGNDKNESEKTYLVTVLSTSSEEFQSVSLLARERHSIEEY